MKNRPRPSRALAPARSHDPAEETEKIAGNTAPARRLLIVDLNNFASFPTFAIGLLVATLRNRGAVVEVLSPLAHDVPAIQRERQERFTDHLKRRLHLSDMPLLYGLRDIARQLRRSHNERPHAIALREVEKALDRGAGAILVSAYLQHMHSVREIARIARARGVPLIVGGPMFNLPEVATEWSTIPGVSLVFGGEADMVVPDLVERLLSEGDPLEIPGVTLPGGRRSGVAPPLRPLDATPVPDFTDFPWDRYPVRIVPLMTGRGCQWDRCLFCSDVISASGRQFRTRSVESVLLEMQEQARRHETTNFLFLDLKLNSWPGMIRGIARDIQRYVQGAEWIGTVHVDQRADNGLARADLELAVESGMRRISFGLESGSQRLLDAMHKGSSVERNAAFIRDADAAGLSIRCTMFKGFPGETAQDMEQTAAFLEEYGPMLDRVRFNDFTLYPGTPVWREMTEKNGTLPGLEITRRDDARAYALYRRREPVGRAYRRAKARALDLVHEINRRPLRDAARQFDGLM